MASLSAEKWLESVLCLVLSTSSVGVKNPISADSSAMKIFDVDRASLSKYGLNKESQDRLYRSFFVYSTGIHNVIKQLTTSSNKHSAMISLRCWTVFTRILEFCEPQHTELILQEIQKDQHEVIQQIMSAYDEALCEKENDNGNLKVKLDTTLLKCDSLEHQLNSLRQVHETMTKSLHSTNESLTLELQQTRDEMEALRADMQQLYEYNVKMNTEIPNLKKEMSQLQDELTTANDVRVLQQDRIKAITNKLSAYETQSLADETEKLTLRECIDAQKLERQTLFNKYSVTIDNLRDCRLENTRLEAELDEITRQREVWEIQLFPNLKEKINRLLKEYWALSDVYVDICDQMERFHSIAPVALVLDTDANIDSYPLSIHDVPNYCRVVGTCCHLVPIKVEKEEFDDRKVIERMYGDMKGNGFRAMGKQPLAPCYFDNYESFGDNMCCWTCRTPYATEKYNSQLMHEACNNDVSYCLDEVVKNNKYNISPTIPHVAIFLQEMHTSHKLLPKIQFELKNTQLELASSICVSGMWQSLYCIEVAKFRNLTSKYDICFQDLGSTTEHLSTLQQNYDVLKQCYVEKVDDFDELTKKCELYATDYVPLQSRHEELLVKCSKACDEVKSYEELTANMADEIGNLKKQVSEQQIQIEEQSKYIEELYILLEKNKITSDTRLKYVVTEEKLLQSILGDLDRFHSKILQVDALSAGDADYNDEAIRKLMKSIDCSGNDADLRPKMRKPSYSSTSIQEATGQKSRGVLYESVILPSVESRSVCVIQPPVPVNHNPKGSLATKSSITSTVDAKPLNNVPLAVMDRTPSLTSLPDMIEADVQTTSIMQRSINKLIQRSADSKTDLAKDLKIVLHWAERSAPLIAELRKVAEESRKHQMYFRRERIQMNHRFDKKLESQMELQEELCSQKFQLHIQDLMKQLSRSKSQVKQLQNRVKFLETVEEDELRQGSIVSDSNSHNNAADKLVETQAENVFEGIPLQSTTEVLPRKLNIKSRSNLIPKLEAEDKSEILIVGEGGIVAPIEDAMSIVNIYKHEDKILVPTPPRSCASSRNMSRNSSTRVVMEQQEPLASQNITVPSLTGKDGTWEEVCGGSISSVEMKSDANNLSVLVSKMDVDFDSPVENSNPNSELVEGILELQLGHRLECDVESALVAAVDVGLTENACSPSMEVHDTKESANEPDFEKETSVESLARHEWVGAPVSVQPDGGSDFWEPLQCSGDTDGTRLAAADEEAKNASTLTSGAGSVDAANTKSIYTLTSNVAAIKLKENVQNSISDPLDTLEASHTTTNLDMERRKLLVADRQSFISKYRSDVVSKCLFYDITPVSGTNDSSALSSSDSSIASIQPATVDEAGMEVASIDDDEELLL